MMTLKGIVSKTAAWAILVIAVTVILVLVVLPVAKTFGETSEDLAMKTELVKKLQAENRRLNDIRTKLGGSDGPPQAHALLLKNFDSDLAGAEIKDYFSHALAQSGGAVQSTQTLAGNTNAEADALQENILRVSMTATLPQLHALLHHLESQRPSLFVDSLNMQAQRQNRQNADAEPLLRIQLNLIGYAKPEAAL